PVEIQPDNTVTVRGEVVFSKAVNLETVRKMITARLGKNDAGVTVEGRDNTREFTFLVKDITRTDENLQLLFSIDGAAGKINHRETLAVNVPAKDRFRLYEYGIADSPEGGLRLVFSDPVSESQDLKSMITLGKTSDYTVQVQANQVMVYFTRTSGMNSLEVTVHAGLKNRTGDALAEMTEFTLSLEPLKPQVELLSSGTIMPNSDNLTLPFRAVALHAIDLKIIRIFESNVLMFLQDNTLEDKASYQLRRAGRLVYKKTLRLDTDPSKDISRWENYSLDLTKLIRQQPGAIYRMELSFRKEYASYECEDSEERARALAGAVDLTGPGLAEDGGAVSEADEAYWDRPDTYYYDGYDLDMDWDSYDWAETDNPCHPTYYMQAKRKAVTNVLASNLGMIAKCSAGHTVWAAVTGLLDTRPVQGAKVTAYNFQLQPTGSGLTDENGFALLSLRNKPFILVASAGEQKTYLRMADGYENMLSRFDVGGVELKKGLKGYIYGERGVWRPGDTLHIAFMLEDRGKKIPAGHPVTFEVYNPRGQFYKKMISTTGADGLYTFDIPTKADDPTGLWNAYAKVGGASFHKSLRIETVKPNRLKINLDLPDIIHAPKGATPAGIHSQWLTGATARSLDAKMELILNRASTQFKGYEQYVFNNPATAFSSSRTDIFDGKLNENGDVTFDMKPPSAANAPGMLRADITCRVFEPGGDASIFTRTVPFSPYASYVGVNFNKRPDEHCLFTDEDHVFDVVTLSPEGKPVNRNGLEFKIYRIGWSWWWESENESFESYVNNSNYTPLFSGKISTVNGKGQIKFRINYPDWGRYLVFVKDTESGHATGGAVLVDWPSWRGRSNKSDPSGIKMLSFSLDRESYNAGEEVTVTIPATAAGGRALVALENGAEVLHREWVVLTAGSDARYVFKVTESMSPNIYIHISLLQPHAATADLPIRMYGVMPVFVSNRESVLAPVVTMSDVLRPETEFEVKVKEKNGKPMSYTLAIVDEGLLDLTNFRTPDPWNEFYAREALGIRTWDMFDYVMGAYAGKYGSLFSIGGDADLNSASARANRFKPVVLYLGPVTLGAGRENRHTLRLPAYAGSVRVMVVAGRDGAYGKADRTVAVRTPLMLLSSLPRVLSAGEKISLPVNVFAMEDNVKNVTVKVETTGKLTSTEGNSRSLTFAAPGDDLVYFPMQTGSGTGIETVTVTATGGGHTSKETIEIEIRNPNPPALTYESHLLEKGRSVELDYALGAVYDGNWVKVEMSRIPSVDISRRFDYLYDYSHFCTEQLTSRALPLLFLSELKDLDEKEAERTKTNITEAISNLYRRQTANGGFAYWAGEGHVNDWVSSYAGSFLVLARERGYHVDNSVINKWTGYQRSVALAWRRDDHAGKRYSYDQSDFLQAYRLYTLALAGAPELGAMNRLKEARDLSLQSRWRLAAAYAMCGKQDAAGELIFNASATVAPYSSNNPTFGSSSRDEAMTLETLVLMNRHEEAFKQARRVSENLSAEQYFSTQSTAYAMVAMGQFASKMSGKFDFEWSLNGKAQKKVTTKKAVYQTQLPVNPSYGKVKIENGNEGVLYVGLSTKSRPVVDSLPAVSENIRLDVSYTDMKGAPVDVTNLMQGADFYAVVKVSNISGRNDYSDVALTHIIPSGWEVYNERMVASDPSASAASSASEGTPSAVFTYQDLRDDRVLTYFDLPAGISKKVRVRLHASYAGEFVLPAILCEAMYDVSAHARTTARRVKVAGNVFR
ncbi:MAG: alpha-2-macroglobulin, partial [Tannerella sp.]|nr:alpha-2-macroglobulin [Tannerella sp.]